MRAPPDKDALVAGILAHDRRALARSITLVESERQDLADLGQAVLAEVLPKTGRAIRLGVSGVPGVGKSTLIETLGMSLVQGSLSVVAASDDESHGESEATRPLRVAVLAVDPSSPLSGGSILGDKTRMERLSRETGAFIRPSPTSGHLGGVARRTREAMLLCEAAGFDVVIVETVGVGQSEAAVAQMVDTFLLLLLPAGGDELQGVKRGILELSDLVVVHKADGDLENQARQTAVDYRRALHLVQSRVPDWQTPVLLASSMAATGIDALWENVLAHRSAMERSGALQSRRAEQAERWMWTAVDDGVRRHVLDATKDAAATVVEQVRAGQMPPTMAALTLLRAAKIPV